MQSVVRCGDPPMQSLSSICWALAPLPVHHPEVLGVPPSPQYPGAVQTSQHTSPCDILFIAGDTANTWEAVGPNAVFSWSSHSLWPIDTPFYFCSYNLALHNYHLAFPCFYITCSLGSAAHCVVACLFRTNPISMLFAYPCFNKQSAKLP